MSVYIAWYLTIAVIWQAFLGEGRVRAAMSGHIEKSNIMGEIALSIISAALWPLSLPWGLVMFTKHFLRGIKPVSGGTR